jgi:3-isopropylmalate dehydrogenase
VGQLPREQRPERGLLGIRKELEPVCQPAPGHPLPGTGQRLVAEAGSGRRPGHPDRPRADRRHLLRPAARHRTAGEENGERVGFNTMVYSESEIRRIGKVAFEAARKRSKKLCSVDKMNVLETTQLWRDVMIETAATTRTSS